MELGESPDSAAGDLLRFYAQVARVQQHTYETLPQALLAPDGPPLERLMHPENLALLRSRLLDLLFLVRERGPASLAQRADEVAHSDAERLISLLVDFWKPEQEPQDRFFARAILQAAAERMAQHFEVTTGYEDKICPFCAGEPVLGVLRSENLGAKRSLVCSLCATEWAFLRARCPVCGEDRNDRLSIYTAESSKHIRVDACDTCKTYVKTIDLSQLGTAVPLVDDIASLSLSLWAAEKGYHRSAANIFDV